MSKFVELTIGVFGLFVFVMLAIVASQNDKMVAEYIAIAGGALIMLKGAEEYSKRLNIESRSKKIKIIPWSVVLLVSYLGAWSFI